eukprot:3465087-Pyramimonas_sp.AAC.2
MAVEAVPDRIRASRPAARATLDLDGRVGHGDGPRGLSKGCGRARVEVLFGPNSANESPFSWRKTQPCAVGPRRGRRPWGLKKWSPSWGLKWSPSC